MRIRGAIYVTVGMMLALLGVTSAGVHLAHANPVRAAVLATAAASSATECPGLRCYSCAFWTAHEVKETLPGFGDQWYPFECADADCPNSCGAATENNQQDATAARTREDIDAVWKVAAGGSGPEMRKFLREHRFATYNAARRSVQVLGCDGAIVSNIPLTEEQIASIAE